MPDNWVPPSYATLVNDGWKPPDYATPVVEEPAPASTGVSHGAVIDSIYNYGRDLIQHPLDTFNRPLLPAAETDPMQSGRWIKGPDGIARPNPNPGIIGPLINDYVKPLYNETIQPLSSIGGIALGLMGMRAGQNKPAQIEEAPIKSKMYGPARIDLPLNEPEVPIEPPKAESILAKPKIKVMADWKAPEYAKPVEEPITKKPWETESENAYVNGLLEKKGIKLEPPKPVYKLINNVWTRQEPEAAAKQLSEPIQEPPQEPLVKRLIGEEEGAYKPGEITKKIKKALEESQKVGYDVPSIEPKTQDAVSKLFSAIEESRSLQGPQEELRSLERSKRASMFAGVKITDQESARKAMSTLAGEMPRITPEPLKLGPEDTTTLFASIGQSELRPYEKARAIEGLTKILNGKELPQPSELKILESVYGKGFAPMIQQLHGGIGGMFDLPSILSEFNPLNDVSMKYSSYQQKWVPQSAFLTGLANLGSKTTRAVLGFHVPGTALSFHGFNEGVRHTIFGSDFNPFSAIGRATEVTKYLMRPNKANSYLTLNQAELTKAVNEGGLKISNPDLYTGLFKGSNLVTAGFNYLTDPTPLFGKVIPALKLKSYQGLVAQYTKAGIDAADAAKLAGYVTNNIYGGLNLMRLQRNPITQQVFRAAALAPDWMETNFRLGKGMYQTIKNPTAPQNRAYAVGITNFLGSYVALNVMNAINNNGKFMYENGVGHEFDVALGQDDKGRTRFFSPYGTAMDMFRIPLTIAHSAVNGDFGKSFELMRSRASEPIQFITDLMTNTDYKGDSLFGKTKYGKPIPGIEQGTNFASDAAGHFLPVGIKSGIDFGQGKIGAENFAAQALQVPMKYSFMPRPGGALRQFRPTSMKKY